MDLQHPRSMKVWKSPVLYFGVLLVMAVIGLLLAPVIVDWNAYRPELEAYGKKLTGREVRIEGPVSARLFPWPRLTAEGVRIVNLPGRAEPDFASAARITMHMTLAGLLHGALDVESIGIEDPVLNLERSPAGSGNWQLAPEEDLLRSDVLSRVQLDQITLTGGTVNFRDRRRGETVTLGSIRADLASPGIAGPWRIRAEAAYGDRPLTISVNTGSYAEGAPFMFGLKVSGADNSGAVYSFDGAYDKGKAAGELRVTPQPSDGGKGDVEGQLKPLTFSAKAKGDFDRIDFTDMQLAHFGEKEQGAFATGSATLKLGRQIEANADLSATMLDLDELVGYKSRDLLRQSGEAGPADARPAIFPSAMRLAGKFAVADSLLAMLPADMRLTGSLNVTALKSEGDTLDNVRLAIEADRNSLRIGQFRAGIPGRSQVGFSGAYRPGAGRSRLDGLLSLESNDLRELASWLWPVARGDLARLWTGSRGRLKLETPLSVTPSEVNLQNARFELDGEQGSGSLSYNAAGRRRVDIELTGGRFDIDAYAPQGLPALPALAAKGAASLLSYVMPRPDAPDVVVKLDAGEINLNAVAARDVKVDLESGVKGLFLRALSVGAVGGARVEAKGLILDSGKGADGSINLGVRADDPSELIQLLGLSGGGALPPWAVGLGQTAIDADLAVKTLEQGTQTTFAFGGAAGQLTLKGNLTAAPDQSLRGTLSVDSPGSARLLTLAGLTPPEQDTLPSAIRLSAAGALAGGFETEVTLQALGARLVYGGKADPFAAGLALDGKLSLLSPDAGPLLASTGIPLAAIPGGLLAVETPLSWSDGQWRLPAIDGQFAGEPVKGSLTLTPGRKVEGSFDTGPLRLPDLLGAALLDWSPRRSGLETGFAAALPFGLSGHVLLSPQTLELHPQLVLRGATVGVGGRDGAIDVSVYRKDENGQDLRLDLTSAGAGASREISGTLSMPVDLASQLTREDGTAVAGGMGQLSIDFRSEGRTPSAALAAAQGSGSFSFPDFRLLGVSPAAFAAALKEAKDASGITRAFDALRSGEGISFGAVSGAISLANGELSVSPVAYSDDGADVTVKTAAELALGQVDIEVALKLKAQGGLPPMSIAYAGPASALVRSENSSELGTALGVTIMQQGIDALEKLQQEQKRLTELEEQQRKEDEARLQAYYAQRDELLLRRREIKVQGEMQAVEAERQRQQILMERAANAELNRAELRQRLRELKVWRRVTRADPLPARPRPAPVTAPGVAVTGPPLRTPAPQQPRVIPPAAGVDSVSQQ